MARTLSNIIRVHEWQVDEKRRKLGDLMRLLDNFEAEARKLEADLITEQQIAATNPSEAGFGYGGYAQSVIQRRERLQQSMVKAEEEIATAREELRDAFRELKKFEIAQENRTKAEAKEEARKETVFLDEVGMQGYLRKKA